MAALPSARRVLIVDNEHDIRTTLHAVFGSAGYDCRTAPNGREAARLFEAEGSPLTITDPGVRGTTETIGPLVEGTYRVTVSGGANVRSATDVFIVANDKV